MLIDIIIIIDDNHVDVDFASCFIIHYFAFVLKQKALCYKAVKKCEDIRDGVEYAHELTRV